MFMLHHTVLTPVDNAIVEATTFSELPGPIAVVSNHGTAATARPARRLVHLRWATEPKSGRLLSRWVPD